MRNAIALIGLAVLLLAPGTAPAADLNTCIAYAKEATSEETKYAAERCEYSGDAWNTNDEVAHLNWCFGASAQQVADESKRRRDAIDKCGLCRAYAWSATAQQGFNEGVGGDPKEPAMACGYAGDMWSKDWSAHVRWCVQASVAERETQQKAREEWNNICNTCRQYARNAVKTYLDVWSKCKRFWTNRAMSSSQWSVDHNGHFGWCMGLGAAQRGGVLANQNGARAAVVEACNASSAKQPLTIQAPTAETFKRVPSKPKPAVTNRVTTANKPQGSSAADTVKPSAANPCKPGKPNDPCKPKRRVVGPGLLEGDSGFGGQGPAGAGAAGGAGGGAAGGGGGSAAVLRSGGSNVVAPPAGGGLR